MVDLEQLKAQVTELGERVKNLKSNPDSPKEEVDKAVQQLLQAKQDYADNNNGIGVDGNPYQPPLTKAQKKAMAKAAKQQTSSSEAASEAAPNTQTQQEGESLNAQKKAAKKAAKKALKAAHKEGTLPEPLAQNVPASMTTTTTTTTPAVVSTTTTTPAITNHTPIVVPSTFAATTAAVATPDPYHVLINPNVPLLQRPVVALTTAVLLDVAVDLTIVADPKCRHTCMGLPSGPPQSSSVAGDLPMARTLLRRHPNSICCETYYGGPFLAAVDSWVDYAQSLLLLPEPQRWNAVVMSLEPALATSTYLVGSSLTLADVALYAAAGFPCQSISKPKIPAQAVQAQRWFRMMGQHPAIQEATQLCLGVNNKVEAQFPDHPTLEPLVHGMSPLEGAVPGRVVTRFPPEPSGYLHIGHAKAVLLNDYYAKRYQGRLIVRFDDTNPSKEKEEYQDSIVHDLALLGVQPDVVSYTSNYFDSIAAAAVQLIREGKAYMDDTPQEQMKLERAERLESKHRNQSVEEALKYFQLMCEGTEEGGAWCLRAKIDMSSDNGTLRDPVLFRQNLEPHHRCGTQYKAYPTYDLACPIVDSLEGVTHALRTTEYNDRDEQYQWLLKALRLRRVRIHAFSRVNFKFTLLSKRKLTWFVENGHVTGWDDARMPTIRGIIRRGVMVNSLKTFMYSQGASRRVVLMDWMGFFSENKMELDKSAKRFMAIDQQNHVKLLVTNGPSAEDYSYVHAPCHPKDHSLGMRAIRKCQNVLLETVDVVDAPPLKAVEVGEEIVLMRWGVVRITKVDGSNLEGEYIPDGDFKAAKRKLSWIADVDSNCKVILTEFDHLVTKDKLDEEDNWVDFVNLHTLATTEVVGDAGLKTLKEHDVIQLERRGFYRVDQPYVNESKPLVMYMIPDGKSKVMSGMQGKLAHH